jgi:biopolymer transport protein ExbD
MAYIPSRIKKHETNQGEVKVNLTSMMDMFTIILVFLIIQYSTEGVMIQPSDYLTLPFSSVEQAAEVALDLVISKEWVIVNQEPVEKVATILAQEGLLIKNLQDKLQIYAREAKRMEEQFGAKFTGRVMIQGDKSTPYKLLVKVMATCGKSDYPNMRLLVYQKQE